MAVHRSNIIVDKKNQLEKIEKNGMRSTMAIPTRLFKEAVS
jgi:hypothetical protein